jgi:hypothetical protein
LAGLLANLRGETVKGRLPRAPSMGTLLSLTLGIALSDADAQRILACRDESALSLYWERAFSAASAAELWGD